MLACLVGTAVLVLAAVIARTVLDNAELSAERSAMERAKTAAERLRRNMDRVGAELESVQGFIVAVKTDYPAIQDRLALAAKRLDAVVAYYSGATPFDEGGVFVSSSGWQPSPGYDQENQKWFALAGRDGKCFVSEPYADISSGRWSITFSMRVLSREDADLGAIGVDVALDDVIPALAVPSGAGLAFWGHEDGDEMFSFASTERTDGGPSPGVSPVDASKLMNGNILALDRRKGDPLLVLSVHAYTSLLFSLLPLFGAMFALAPVMAVMAYFAEKRKLEHERLVAETDAERARAAARASNASGVPNDTVAPNDIDLRDDPITEKGADRARNAAGPSESEKRASLSFIELDDDAFDDAIDDPVV